jgi:hypothetical protein
MRYFRTDEFLADWLQLPEHEREQVRKWLREVFLVAAAACEENPKAHVWPKPSKPSRFERLDSAAGVCAVA